MGVLSKNKSQISINRFQKLDDQRAANFNSDLILKLSYDWKNIYRALLSGDILQKGETSVKKLNQALLNHKISLTKEELRRLVKLSKVDQGGVPTDQSTLGSEDPMTQTIDYLQLSKNLGLHKPSLKLIHSNGGTHRQGQIARRLMQQLGGGAKKSSPDSILTGEVNMDGSEQRNNRKVILKPVQSARAATSITTEN